MTAEYVALYLAAQGIRVGGLGEDLFVDLQPAEPASCTTLIDEAAAPPEGSSGLAFDAFGLQVIDRDPIYAAARDRIMEIHRAIVGFGGARLDPSGPVVEGITIQTPPASIGRDRKKRAEWSAHYVLRVCSTGDSFRL